MSLDGSTATTTTSIPPFGSTSGRDVGRTADLSWAVTRVATSLFMPIRKSPASRAAVNYSVHRTGAPVARSDRVGVRRIALGGWVTLERAVDYFVMDSRGESTCRRRCRNDISTIEHPVSRAKAERGFRATPALEIIGNLRYEHFDADDWALDGVEPDNCRQFSQVAPTPTITPSHWSAIPPLPSAAPARRTSRLSRSA